MRFPPPILIRHFGIERYPALELHPETADGRFTLMWISRDEEAAVRVAIDQERDGFDTLVAPFTAPNGDPMFSVSVRRTVTRTVRTGLPRKYSSDWQFVRTVLMMFRHVSRNSGQDLRWYKRLEIEKIRAIGQAIDWSAPRIETATSLLSLPILRHALPLANHRTSLWLTYLFFSWQGIKWPSYDLRGRGIHRLYREMNSKFVVESKYHLQLLRRQGLVKLAYESGIRGLRIGPTRFRLIDPEDLGLSRGAIEETHADLARRFILSQSSPSSGPTLEILTHGGREGFTRWALS